MRNSTGFLWNINKVRIFNKRSFFSYLPRRGRTDIVNSTKAKRKNMFRWAIHTIQHAKGETEDYANGKKHQKT